MTTPKAVTRRLKAAAKRRSRRLAAIQQAESLKSPGAGVAASDDSVAESDDSVDVSGMMAQLLVDRAASDPTLKDADVLTALRACLNGTTPRGDQARQLAERLGEIADAPDVSVRRFRKASEEMLSMAEKQQDSGQVDPFLQWLRLLSR